MSTKQWITGVALVAASSVALAFSNELYVADFGLTSVKTRAQVIQELQQAQADGTYQASRNEAPDPLVWSTRQGSGSPQSAIAAANARVFGTTPVQAIALKDGSTVYVFNDGRMGMESRYGRADRMAPGHVMQAQDGRSITMVGDEVARVDMLHHAEFPGGR